MSQIQLRYLPVLSISLVENISTPKIKFTNNNNTNTLYYKFL